MTTFLQRMERNEEIREAQSARLSAIAACPSIAAANIQAMHDNSGREHDPPSRSHDSKSRGGQVWPL